MSLSLDQLASDKVLLSDVRNEVQTLPSCAARTCAAISRLHIVATLRVPPLRHLAPTAKSPCQPGVETPALLSGL
jgi:hypothetical protein